MIDYISLMLVNMAAGLAVLAFYLLFAIHRGEARSWAPAFAMPGLVALLTGLHMTLTWPIPDLSKIAPKLPNLQFANVAFGEMSVLFGVLFLAAALALAKGWSLLPMSIFAFFAGAVAILVGIRLWCLGLTRTPAQTGVGFILTGVGGLLTAPFVRWRHHFVVRLIPAVVLLAAAALWAYTGGSAFWGHLQRFSTAAK